jgi:TetR/AcrR family transcriptional repressor of lmrAB and yxaGH operons
MAISTSRQSVVEATKRLLSEEGYSSASTARILEVSGAPRGSLYHYFPGGKAQMIAEALQDFDREFSALVRSSMARPGSVVEKLQRLAHALGRELQRRDYRYSCPVSIVLVEETGDGEEAVRLRNACTRIFSGWAELVASYFTHLEAAEAKALGLQCVSALEGGWLLSRAFRSQEPLLSALAMLEVYLRHKAEPAPNQRP